MYFKRGYYAGVGKTLAEDDGRGDSQCFRQVDDAAWRATHGPSRYGWLLGLGGVGAQKMLRHHSTVIQAVRSGGGAFFIKRVCTL